MKGLLKHLLGEHNQQTHDPTKGSDVKLLKDGIVTHTVTVESLRKYYKTADDAKLQGIADRENEKRALSDTKIKFESTEEQNAKFQNSVRVGRSKVLGVHKEVTGVMVVYRNNAALNAVLNSSSDRPGARGAYGSQTIFLGPQANAETYIHEYGHFLDNMLGRARGASFYSDISDALKPGEERWYRHESFAEFYVAWVHNKGNPTKTSAYLREYGGWSNDPNTESISNAWDALLRKELVMK